MRSPRKLFAILTLALGALIAGGNVWYSAARSTIPLGFDHPILAKELRPEKIPGIDDVYLLHFGRGKELQVDRAIFDAVSDGESIRKAAWSRELKHDGRSLRLEWSEDARGMMIAMPLALAVCILLATIIRTCGSPSSTN